MDRLPLVPQHEEDHDVLPIITEVFQDTFKANKYPKNVAENYEKYRVDTDCSDLQTTGLTTIKVLEKLDTRLEDISQVEEEIMRNHAMGIIQRENNLEFYEQMRLKRHEIFKRLSEHALAAYNLLQRTDLYPNRIEQYLDFTYNPLLHTCQMHCPSTKTEVKVLSPRKKRHRRIKSDIPVGSPFKADPEKIIFYNYEPSQVYKQKFKLRNITKQSHDFSFYPLPRQSPFRLKMLTSSCRLAPGMFAEFLLEFRPHSYQSYVETLKFKTVKGIDLNILVFNARDPPKLICYIFNPFLPWNTVKKPGPGSKYFSDRRQNALNFTIDCGTCLLGNYSLITVMMKNEGRKGRFLITTENEWVFSQLDDGSTRSLELIQGCFSIFPVLFEIGEGEVGEIFILFVPEQDGFFTEKFYIICDNNTHQEVEVLGDCCYYMDNFLKVNMYLLQDTFTYSRRTVTINLAPKETSGFIFSIINNSPIHFSYYWAFKTSTEETEDEKKMDPNWIHMLHGTEYLPSFSITDVVVQLTPETAEEGSYYIYLSLYLKNIPTSCMAKDAKFSIRNENKIEENGPRDFLYQPPSEISPEDKQSWKTNNSSYQYADVHIFELGIFCTVEKPPPSTITTVSVVVQESTIEKKSLRLSKTVLNFGVLPIGVKGSKCLFIENLTNDEIDWKIIEIHYTDETNLCISSEAQNVTWSKGTLKKKCKRKIAYAIETKEPVRWISILALFSCPTCTCQTFSMEAVCLVIYQVAEVKITIRTDHYQGVLCPRDFLYVGIPSIHTVYIHNAGIITGCFYFFKPTGTEIERIRVKLQPQSGVVRPGATVEVKVELYPIDYGPFEDIYVPCFVGDPDRLISLKIICIVSTINVYFCLPARGGGYDRYLWPPKSEMPTWNSETVGEGASPVMDGGEWMEERPVEPAVDESLMCLIGVDSVVATYPTIQTELIHVKKATKLTFYIENLTPVHGHFVVNPSNYGPENECINHILVKAKTRAPEFFLEKACVDGYGIVIEAVRRSGDIASYEIIEIDLWIYANTWGKYLEEVIIEINDLTPFCFNLLLEVVGSPIEFPFARNTILPCPTIRFENVAYASKNNTKSFTVTNISSVPIEINWHMFTRIHEHGGHTATFNLLLQFEDDTVNLTVAPKFYGCEACTRCIDITPCYFILEKQSTTTIKIKVSSSGFIPDFDKTFLNYKLLGFIGLKSSDKFKENYFERQCGFDIPPIKVKVLVTQELPIMQVDITSDDTKIDLFVNDILINNEKFPEAYLLLRNVDKSTIRFGIEIEKPFKIIEARTVPSGITDQQNLVLQRHECLQLMVTCNLSWEDLIAYSELIYEHNEVEDVPERENFISVISKDLNIYQKGFLRQMIPFQVRLHYPHIRVKPTFIRFGHCLLYRSKKTIFTIYNMTGAIAKFEIFKTTKYDSFEVSPCYGEIAGSTGVNKQFVDIAVYFTPRHCKLYLENLRIMTNIPNYYIDLSVGGYGSNNEKFNV